MGNKSSSSSSSSCSLTSGEWSDDTFPSSLTRLSGRTKPESFQVLLVGAKGVGKQSFANVLAFGVPVQPELSRMDRDYTFENVDLAALGVDTTQLSDKQKTELTISCTVLNPQFPDEDRLLVHQVKYDVCFLCVDVTDRQSLDYLRTEISYIKSAKQNAAASTGDSDHDVYVLLLLKAGEDKSDSSSSSSSTPITVTDINKFKKEFKIDFTVEFSSWRVSGTTAENKNKSYPDHLGRQSVEHPELNQQYLKWWENTIRMIIKAKNKKLKK